MKYLDYIKKWGTAAVAAVCLCTSCDYLDVVPPEQANLQHATSTRERALGFLYSCYRGIMSTDPTWTSYLDEVISSTDETVLPYSWSADGSWDEYAFNTATAMNQNWIWGTTYQYVGQCLLFLQEIEKMDQSLVPAETMKVWKAEAKALIAYYHFCTLRRYGPIPITDYYIAMDAPQSEYRGRYHFDYCVDWIANQLDEAAEDLPTIRDKSDEWGRLTKVIAKCIKARLLLYAASPLWNGEFPYPQWKNKNFETPDYGYELVSHTYDPSKWDRALQACQEAISLAESAGYELYDDEDYYTIKQLPLPYVPGVTDGDITDEAAKEKFLKTVMKMRFLVATRSTDGNKEIIWGNWNHGLGGAGEYARLPLRIVRQTNGNWFSAYSGVAPTLNSVEAFYTKNGKLPARDPEYTPEADWLRPSGIKHSFTNAVGDSKSLDIANLHVGREPRFYAWIAFDGGEFAPKLMDGKPLVLEMRNKELHGYNPALFNRDYSATGYLTQKFINPAIQVNTSGFQWGDNTPSIQIRLAELYLNIAECYAAKGDVPNALNYLNRIRRRADVPELTTEDVTSAMPIMEWVRNERFIELWGEGHRFYDVRRWALGAKYFGEGVRRGLNAALENPDYDTFYQNTAVPSPYVWSNRMYLNPVFYNEVYKNPQMVQAPEY